MTVQLRHEQRTMLWTLAMHAHDAASPRPILGDRRAACRSWAHRVEEPYSIWGGKGEDERRAALRRRRPSRRPAA